MDIIIEDGQEESPDADVEELKEELEAIQVTAEPIIEPTIPNITKEDFSEYPESYKDNTNKEKLILAYVENYRRQYVHLFRDRKPLFLNPLNECGIEKFVCTTLRPTLLSYKALYHWQGCAEFVADYLTMKQLEPPQELPMCLFSPSTILKRQLGNCFDFSNILCSLLLGAGYDAYVVSGYATKEICLADESRQICPLLQPKKEVLKEAEKPEPRKYTVKPPRDLRSKFIIKMEARRKKEAEEEEKKKQQEEEERIAELEKPPPDALYGLRIHAWVLVRGGKREVPEDFFIEPFTGQSYPPSSPSFLGIESVWNSTNYWANMQNCASGCKDMSFDLMDTEKWEYMLAGSDQTQIEIPDAEEELYDLDDDEKENEDEKHLDMPATWVLPICVTKNQYEMRCPQGKKTTLYKKAKLEKYANYLLKDGLVTRLSVYDNNELTDLKRVQESFENREDKLTTRVHQGGLITEDFVEGRPRSLQQHVYKASNPGPEAERTMTFFHKARVDGLCKREETPTEMTEHFVNRDDFLFLRHVLFGKRQKKVAPATAEGPPRPILKITEKFHRNDALSASKDVEEQIFIIHEDKIQITYHREDPNITASTRDFYKPPNAEEKGGSLQWSNDMTNTFQVNPHGSPAKNLAIYENLLQLIQTEQKSIQAVRSSEEEVKEILMDRQKEELASELAISVYDTERNEKAKKHRKELERLAMEEKLRRQEMEMDYLAPFLAQIGNPDKISKTQAFKLKEDCLADLKQRLIDKANLIQLRFEKETSELHKRQQDYQQKQVAMTKEDEEQYFNYCSEAMFRIHILELRLNRHKQMAPHKYMQLEQKLRQDPRLSVYF
uniref:dynein regulatory complex subunit 7 n=1 Tax=Ciona intestinalis TaxID=7719 RepID=UPI000180C9A8|nr:dynein regulatory complex subunit 7 [Ciona intestinalis]|eukprot:XP_009860275.1 dynein regulatory complex subunit 7 [Ciona intestinalis]